MNYDSGYHLLFSNPHLVEDLICHFVPLDWVKQPDLGYYLIEERLHPVESGDSRVGLLFEIGNCSSREQLEDVIQRLAALTEQPEDTALRRAFLQWIKWVLSQNNRIDFAIDNISDLSEIHVMLNTRIDQWGKKMLEQGREEGLEKGREQGKTIGKQLGESTLLYQQLERRFGPLPDWVGEKLSSADSESLENWGIALLDAKTLKEVFTESSE